MSDSEESSSSSAYDTSSKQDSSSLQVEKSADKENKRRLEVFDEYFQNVADNLLLICTQNGLLFVDNRKRDKVFLEVMYEDLIYCMGRGSVLKIGLLCQKKLSYGDNQFFDVRTEFGAKHARVIAEDIMAYCQLFLLENCSETAEYLDIVKRSAFEMFNQDEEVGFTSNQFTSNEKAEQNLDQTQV